MSKRQAEFQGGADRYGGQDAAGDMADKPQRATAAQMAKRTIAQARKPSGSQRSSRAGTPTAFGQQPAQQSMPSFQPPEQNGTGFGGDFNFAVNSGSNPFAQTNGAVGTPPPTFGFGDTSSQTQQNGSSIFGNTNTSFGSTFNSQPPQQNGFNPSTTSMFGQNQNDTSKTNASSIFAGFGQNSSNQTQQNGLTPSTNNSFPSFDKQNENPFKGFGQTPQQTQSTANTSFNSFGQSTQQNGEKTPGTGFVFGQSNNQAQPSTTKSLFGTTSDADQTPKTATSNIFAGFGQQNKQGGDKALFTSTSQAEQTPSTSTNIFGSQSNNALGLFGATPPPESGTQTPKPGESIFGALNQSKNNGISADMFTKSRDQTPNPTASNPFGRPPAQNSADAAEQAPKPTNMFGGLNESQPNGVKSSLFSNKSTSEPEQQGSTTSLFNFGQQQTAQTPQQSAAPMFKFGQSAQDASMTTPGNTPQKPAGTSTEQTATADSSSNASAVESGGLFGRVNASEDATPIVQKPLFQPATSLFNSQPAVTPAPNAQPQQTPATQTTNLFGSIAQSEAPATAFKPSFTPSTSLTNKPADKTAAPWLSHAPAAPLEQIVQPSPAPAMSSQSATTTVQVAEVIPEAEQKTLKVLNEGMKQHLARQNPNEDWTPIMKYYMQQAAKIRKKPEPKFDAVTFAAAQTPAQPTAPASAFNAMAQTPAQPSTVPAATQSTSALFNSATPTASAPLFQQTPRPSLFQPPQTAPVNKKRSAENEMPQQPPATEKRARSIEPTEYPKLPDNASETAKLFQAALNKSSSNASSSFKPPAAATEKTSPAKEAPAPNFGGFKPSTSTGFTPSTSSGMPKFSAPAADSGGGFLAAFGKKANAQEEQERKKRKAEDYDSDEETEEAWAERDKVEQAAKRQKILDAARIGSGFTPSGSAATTPAPESDIGEGSEIGSERGDDTDAEAPAEKGKSLFDRITPRESPAPGASKPSLFSAQTSNPSQNANLFAPKTPSGLGTSSMTNSNLFSQLSTPRKSIEIADDDDKAEAEKEQGSGDHTWKPNTPIKFGGTSSTAAESTTPAAPPPFSNLFGNLNKPNTTESNGHLNVPKPNFGFNFGGQPLSAATSRASTPGFTTDGEGASTAGEDNAEEEHAPAEPQVEDQTGLRESEKENEDLLFNVHMAKGMKWGEKKNDAGEIVWGWVDKGKGPVYILKHKESGKVRIVLKVPPYGTPRMNFEPLKNVEYEVPKSGSGKMVQGIFVDHLDEKVGKDGSKPGLSKWLIQVGKKEDAEKMAKVLMENRTK